MNTNLLYQLIAILMLACVYILGKNLPVSLLGHPRRWLSAAAGASVAYVFIRALPEMSEAQETFTRVSFNRNLPFPELRVYTAGLIGFLFFYGLEHMVSRPAETTRKTDWLRAREGYGPRLGGFAAYSGLIGYLVVHQNALPTLLYLVAMALHFLTVDHSLGREYGARYYGSGRWLLAGAILVGGFAGIATSMSEDLLATLLGLNSGGVIINSMIMELPKEKEGRFWPFCLGALAYSLLLLLI
jgi:uncharacterized protein YqgC (DUF456 family)